MRLVEFSPDTESVTKEDLARFVGSGKSLKLDPEFDVMPALLEELEPLLSASNPERAVRRRYANSTLRQVLD